MAGKRKPEPQQTPSDVAAEQRRRSRMHGRPPATKRVENKKRKPRQLLQDLADQRE